MPVDAAQSLFESLRALKATADPGAALLQFCRDRLGPLEPLIFDYKEKHDRRKPDLEDDDRGNVAKATSGFANSAGGVLIWGIKDRTLDPKPIQEVAAFMSRVQELAGDCVFPKASGIEADWLPETGAGTTSGFGLLFVPQSTFSPHQVILANSKVQHYYFVRRGGAFDKASHYQLEDMFSRRAKPALMIEYKDANRHTPKDWRLRFEIRNDGRGSARSVFLIAEMNDVIVKGPYKSPNFDCVKNDAFKSGGMVCTWKWDDIHPGMSQTIWGLHLMEEKRQVTPTVKVRFKLFAEGMIPEDLTSEFGFPELVPI